MSALHASQLVFTHGAGPRRAIDGLNLEVPEGSFVGLLGPNGAGKTTFVNLVCGLLSPDSGQLTVFGHPARSAEARAAIGACPQELALFPTLTADENLKIMGRLAGLRGQRLRRRMTYCLDMARLGDERDKSVENYSGGMKRRLNLAIALIHEPRLLLLDEPTVGVDMQSRLAIFESLQALSAAGTTIVYTTHYMEEVERLCDHVLVIDKGQTLASSPTPEFIAHGRDALSFRLTLSDKRPLSEILSEAVEHGLRASQIGAHEIELVGESLAQVTTELARLTENGDVTSCETHSPTLEERFLKLTGEELRD
jgi:ABC-2 type transport system ATP-binding protein